MTRPVSLIALLNLVTVLIVSAVWMSRAQWRQSLPGHQIESNSSLNPVPQSVSKSSGRASVGVKTDMLPYREPPPPPLPAAGGTFTDQTFGTEIMRVTDARNSGANAGTSYSYWPTFNSDNTRILVQDDGAPIGFSIFAFDPVNFHLGSKLAPLPSAGGGYPIGFSTDAIWSHNNPDILYGHSGAKFFSYNCASRKYSLLFDLARRLPPDTNFFQASMSVDDDVFAVTLKKAPAWNVTGYLVYRLSTDEILLKSTDDNNEVRIDKSGRYLYVNTNDQGPGKIEGIVIDLQTGQHTNLTDDAPGQAPSHYDVGTNLIVGNSNYLPGITARKMSDPLRFIRILDTGKLPNFGGFHLSLLGDDESKVLVGFYGVHTSGVMQNELVLIDTTGKQKVWRLVHHHSLFIKYNDSPRANISQDGRFLAFTSNWGVPNGRHDLFVAKIPSFGPRTTSQPPYLALPSAQAKHY
jgi:hypothetical protein